MRVRRADGVLSEVVDDRALLVDPSGRELLTLSPVGSLVWEALDTRQDLDGLVDRLADRFPEVARGRLRTDVSAFLDALRQHQLIVEE